MKKHASKKAAALQSPVIEKHGVAWWDALNALTGFSRPSELYSFAIAHDRTGMWLQDMETLDRVAEAYIAHSRKQGYWAYFPTKVEYHKAGETGYRDRLDGYRAGLRYFLKNRNNIAAAFLNIIPSADDPIFVLIETHRNAEKAFSDVVTEEQHIEEQLNALGIASCDQQKHPLMRAHKRKWDRAERSSSKALRALCNTKPVTFDGYAALMTYLLPTMEKGADTGAYFDGRTDNLFKNLVTSINCLIPAKSVGGIVGSSETKNINYN